MKTMIVTVAAALLFAPLITGAAEAPRTLTVYAAGSLTGVLADIAKSYTQATGEPVRIVNGPAGVLRERIEKGEPVDVYVSANMAHPTKLAGEGKATPPVVFTRNSLCVTTLPGAGYTSANLLDRLMAPGVRIGTSTPGADPGGDYAWAFFAKAETVRPGAKAALESRAQKLVGGAVPTKVPGGGDAVTYFLEHHQVDVFFGYCSSHNATPNPALTKVEVPSDLAIPVDYGMSVVLRDNDPARLASAYRFALYAMSPAAQADLPRYGFRPVATAEPLPR